MWNLIAVCLLFKVPIAHICFSLKLTIIWRYFSFFQRCQMNEDPGVQYIKSWEIGGTILGLNGLGVVVESSNPNYTTGDLVQGSLCWPWELYFIENLEAKKKLFSKVSEIIFKYIYTIGFRYFDDGQFSCMWWLKIQLSVVISMWAIDAKWCKKLGQR